MGSDILTATEWSAMVALWAAAFRLTEATRAPKSQANPVVASIATARYGGVDINGPRMGISGYANALLQGGGPPYVLQAILGAVVGLGWRRMAVGRWRVGS